MHVLVAEEDKIPLSKLFSAKIFWLLFFLMLCAGASEQAMSQWSSYFAERGLGVSKTLGDLLGPCIFALTMALSRRIYPRVCERFDLRKIMILSSSLCAVCYAISALSQNAFISLVGCGICGFTIGIMWPGTLCMATERINGGVKMFALLALAGDMGCTLGPTAAGWIADAAGNDLKVAFIFSIIFPILMIIFIPLIKLKTKDKKVLKG